MQAGSHKTEDVSIKPEVPPEPTAKRTWRQRTCHCPMCPEASPQHRCACARAVPTFALWKGVAIGRQRGGGEGCRTAANRMPSQNPALHTPLGRQPPFVQSSQGEGRGSLWGSLHSVLKVTLRRCYNCPFYRRGNLGQGPSAVRWPHINSSATPPPPPLSDCDKADGVQWKRKEA